MKSLVYNLNVQLKYQNNLFNYNKEMFRVTVDLAAMTNISIRKKNKKKEKPNRTKMISII